MSRILLAGGAGYIGSHTAVELLNSGYDVIIADNYSNSCPEAVKRVEEITGKSVKTYEVDIKDTCKLEEIFKENEIDAVIHFAGLKAVGESVAKPVLYYRNNIDTTLSLLECMNKYNVKKIIFSSSATVYGTPKKVPLSEEDPVGGCTNPYGQNKLDIEFILKDEYKANPKMNIAILRYFNPIGAHPSGLIGEDPQGIPNNLMPYITQVAVGKRDHLNIFGNDYDTKDGTGVRDYLHVVDLAKGHVKSIERLRENHGLDIYNIGTGVGTSVLDIVNAFEKANGIKIPYVFTNRRSGDVAINYADPTKAYLELGFKCELDLLDMCKDSWNFQKNNPEGIE